MTLRKRTLIVIGVTIMALIAAIHVTSRLILLDSFVHLERQDTEENVERALSALSDELSVLDATAADWASWDDTYQFMEDTNPQYVESNLPDDTFVTLRLNLMLLVDSSGSLTLGKAFDLDEEEVAVPQSVFQHLSSGALLPDPGDTDTGVKGILLLPQGPMLVASRAILTSEDEGPARGALVMGRYLDSAEISLLARTTHLSVAVQRFDDQQAPADFQAAIASWHEDPKVLVQPLSEDSVAGYTTVKDIYGDPALMLRVDMPRSIYQHGQATVSYLILSLVLVALVFAAITMVLLESQVLRPLAHLSRSVSRVTASGDITARIEVSGSDELASLGLEINRMLEGLEHAQAQQHQCENRYQTLFEQSRDAVYITTREGAFVATNQAFLALFGYTKEELATLSAPRFYADPADRTRFQEEIERTGAVTDFEATLLRKDGTRIDCLLTSSLRKAEDGSVTGYQGIIRDITEQKQADQEKAQLISSLEFLSDAATQLVELPPEADIYAFIGDKLRALVPGSIVAVASFDQASDTFLVRAVSGVQSRLETIVRHLGRDLVGLSIPARPDAKTALGTRVMVKVGPDLYKQTSGRIPKPIARLLKTALGLGDTYAMGLAWEGELLGAVVILPPAEPAMAGQDIMETFVNQASVALQRKQAETSLRESEERYRQIVDNASDIIYSHDLEGNFTSVNPAALRTYGYTVEETMRLNIAGVVDPSYLPLAQNRIREKLAGVEQTGPYELLTYTKEGEPVWVEVSTRLVATENEPPQIHGVARDITERKKAQEAARQSESRYRTLFQQSRDAIYITTREGAIVEANQAFLRLFDYTGDEIKNVDAVELYADPRDRRVFQQDIEGRGAVSDYEVTLRAKDGTKMDCLLTSNVRWNDDGTVAGYEGIIRDITQQKQAAETIKHLAFHDSLTGLPNRTLFVDRLGVALADARRRNQRPAVMLLDLDRFKHVNDTLGHTVGDQLLQAVGSRLTGILRETDTVCRMGGDEFLLLISGTDQHQEASLVADKVLRAVREPFALNGHELNISTSLGIAIYPEDGKDVETLIKNADIAMYRAKERGRDNFQRYSATDEVLVPAPDEAQNDKPA
jgi:diguanylate cyclase (GGDEF)-like protein/PAS domain S-box-containing protein